MQRTPAEWVEAYGDAWRRGDLELAADLFSANVSYSFDPFGAPLRGRDAVVDYWSKAISSQTDLSLSIRVFATDRTLAAAEWWASFSRDQRWVTLSASLLLSFDAEGRCCELHEHWAQWDGRLDPPGRFLEA